MPQFALPSFGKDGNKSDHLRLDGHCPSCGNLFDFRKTQVLAEENGSTLLHLKCGNCGTSAVATMTMSPQGLMFRGMITDLTAQDVMKFKDVNDVDSDDIMELHKVLEDNGLTNG